jgi:outer membrane protein OmpA-like peptidoglycan-associated protein
VSLLILMGLAFGQTPAVPTLSAQHFRPSIDASRLLWTDEATRHEDGLVTGRFLFQGMANPLVYRSVDTGKETVLLSHAVMSDLLVGASLYGVRVGIDLPIVLASGGAIDGGGAGLGDLQLDGRWTALDSQQWPIGLALSMRVTTPTTTVDAPLGNNGVGWEASAIVDRRFGPLLLAANVGTRGLPRTELENVTWNDQLSFRTGAGYDITPDMGLSAELAGHVAYSAPLANRAGTPMEWLLGGWGYVAEDVVVRAGTGTGITPGLGSPDFRAMVGVGYEPRPSRDTDGDGLFDATDRCPELAEDMDGFQDRDGCPEDDNDGDGFGDLSDPCPNEAEDLDGYLDDDGCPDLLTLVTVAAHALGGEPLAAAVRIAGPTRAEGTGSVQAELVPGVYELVGEHASYAPAIRSVVVPNGPPMAFGLDFAPSSVVVNRATNRLDLSDSIFFELDTAAIRTVSYPLLDMVARAIYEHEEIVSLRIEGHTDSRGSTRYNQRLSDMRAEAVRGYLISAGIDPARVRSLGFGERYPREDREDEKAWAANRRVDFIIDGWKDQP